MNNILDSLVQISEKYDINILEIKYIEAKKTYESMNIKYKK